MPTTTNTTATSAHDRDSWTAPDGRAADTPASSAGVYATRPERPERAGQFGHDNAVRLLSVFASVGASGNGSSSPAPSMPSTGGGCGSACGCHH